MIDFGCRNHRATNSPGASIEVDGRAVTEVMSVSLCPVLYNRTLRAYRRL